MSSRAVSPDQRRALCAAWWRAGPSACWFWAIAAAGALAACGSEEPLPPVNSSGGSGGAGGCAAEADCTLPGTRCEGGMCLCSDSSKTLCAETGCVDTETAISDCGGCGIACPSAHATATCVEGSCGLLCEPGFLDCDSDPINGCEVDTTSNDDHCGQCGQACFLHCTDSVCNDPIDVSAGVGYTCVVLREGSLWCWGLNSSRQLGFPPSGHDQSTPALVPLSGKGVQITAGGDDYPWGIAHTCVLLADATVQCWGRNTDGQVGEAASDPALPTVVPIDEVKEIRAGGAHTCAVRNNGELLCWGDNEYGQLGNGTTDDTGQPTIVAADVTQVAVGGRHTCALHTNGEVSCWGRNDRSQLGIESTEDQSSPTLVSGLAAVDQITARGSSSCARNAAGLFCWGSLGSPRSFLGLARTSWIALGWGHVSAVKDGVLWMWGSNAWGELGDGTGGEGSGSWEPAPGKVVLTEVAQTALGDRHSCALRTTGELLCWGEDARGTAPDSDPTLPAPVVWP